MATPSSVVSVTPHIAFAGIMCRDGASWAKKRNALTYAKTRPRQDEEKSGPSSLWLPSGPLLVLNLDLLWFVGLILTCPISPDVNAKSGECRRLQRQQRIHTLLEWDQAHYFATALIKFWTVILWYCDWFIYDSVWFLWKVQEER